MSRNRTKVRIKLRDPGKLLRSLLVLVLVIALALAVPKALSRPKDGVIKISDYPLLKSALENAGVRTSRSMKGGFSASISSDLARLEASSVKITYGIARIIPTQSDV